MDYPRTHSRPSSVKVATYFLYGSLVLSGIAVLSGADEASSPAWLLPIKFKPAHKGLPRSFIPKKLFFSAPMLKRVRCSMKQLTLEWPLYL